MNAKRKMLVLLLLLVCLLSGIVIGIVMMRERIYDKDRLEAPGPGAEAGGGVALVIDPQAEEGLPDGNDTFLEQGVVIAGQESMTIPANKKEAAVDFLNPEENAQKYYLTFELRLYGGNGKDYEVLYTSGLVEPGKRIRRITLSRELDPGIYDAVVHVQPYRMNEQKTLTNNADMRIRLIVN